MAVNVIKCSDFVKKGILNKNSCDIVEHHIEETRGYELGCVERKVSMNGSGEVLVLIECCKKQEKNVFKLKDEDIYKVWKEVNCN